MSRRLLSLSLASAVLFLCGCSKNSPQPLAPPDTNPPGSIVDVSAAAVDSFTITLSWTAPGSDGAAGTASAYEIRVGNLDSVPSFDWTNWPIWSSPPSPQAAGTRQTLQLTGLAGGAPYGIALRTRDAAGNWSGQSNVALCQTTGYRSGPVLVVSSQSAPYARVSENGGRTWVDGVVPGSQVMFGWLTRAGNAPNFLYATAPAFRQHLLGAAASRIWLSGDHGLTWEVATEAVTGATANLHWSGCGPLIASPSHLGTLFVSLSGTCDANGNNCCDICVGQIFRSTDVGLTWTAIGGDLPRQQFPPYQNGQLPFPAMAVDPTDPQKIYIGRENYCFSTGGGTACFNSFWRTTNGGATWNGAGSGLSGISIFSLDVVPSIPSHLLASTDHGIYLSENEGASWANVSPVTGAYVFTFDPSNAQVMYTPISRSVDGGHSWTPMPTPDGGRTRIEIDPSRNELYAVGTGGVYLSADGGDSWRQILASNSSTSLVVLPDLP